MERDSFLRLPVEEVAQIVKANGPTVCVFPINGTRRWFVLEYGSRITGDPIEAYKKAAIQRQLELCGMLFDHGVDTLVTPVLGPDLMERSNEYARRIGIDGLVRAATDAQFLDFYKERGVRVHFYGDYQEYLKNISYGQVVDLLHNLTRQTSLNRGCRLFYGVFAGDATQTVINLSVKHFKANGTVPNKRTLIEMYYGEYVDPVSFFIGFDKFTVFDMPLISTGEEDLYFSVSPSPYMTQTQLRAILYDHLYTRRTAEPDYKLLDPEHMKRIRDFYLSNQDIALGVGSLESGVWLPVH